MSKKYNSNRGGARDGAGRPKGSVKPNGKVSVGLRIDAELIKWVRNHPRNNIDIVEDALREYIARNPV